MNRVIDVADRRMLHARALYEALRGRSTLPPLSSTDPALTIDDAYAISLATLKLRERDGERELTLGA